MSTVAFGHVAVLTEQHSFSELRRALYKNVTLGLGSKVVELVLIKYRVFWFMCAINKLLVDFPTYGTNVAILTKRLFDQAPVVV